MFGSLLSYAFSQSISVGASGAIFGIIGATTVYFFRYRNNFGAQGRAILQNMIVVIVINLIFGFSAGYIDNWGHIGGLLGGALVAIGSGAAVRSRRRWCAWAQPVAGSRTAQVGMDRGWSCCTLLFVGGVMLVNLYYQDASYRAPLEGDKATGGRPMEDVRRSGVLLHVTSLPGKYGIGTLNQEAYHWVDFLAQTRQTLWQVLPLGPTGYGDSPYQSFSSFAGNPYLISLEELVEMGLLDQGELDNAPDFPREHVDFGAIYTWKMPLLRHVAEQFDCRASADTQGRIWPVCGRQCRLAGGLCALHGAQGCAQRRAVDPVGDAAAQPPEHRRLSTARQDARSGAAQPPAQPVAVLPPVAGAQAAMPTSQGILIVGDIPIFVAMDSSDAWTNPEEFFLDDQYHPTVVAGVPPDYF